MPERPRDDRTGESAAAARMGHRARWVDLQIERAVERGDFDNLPGYGKPIKDIGHDHDPDWWLRKLVEREQITGVLPASLQIRKDDAELNAVLDRIGTEIGARREVTDFNSRVRKAQIQPLGGPPMITQERDVEEEVERWAVRRTKRIEAQRVALAEVRAQDALDRQGGGRRLRLWPSPRRRKKG